MRKHVLYINCIINPPKPCLIFLIPDFQCGHQLHHQSMKAISHPSHSKLSVRTESDRTVYSISTAIDPNIKICVHIYIHIYTCLCVVVQANLGFTHPVNVTNLCGEFWSRAAKNSCLTLIPLPSIYICIYTYFHIFVYICIFVSMYVQFSAGNPKSIIH